MSSLNIALSGLTGCSCTLCTPGNSYTVISNETLSPLLNDGTYYYLDFGTICPGTIVNHELTICNFSLTDFNFCSSIQDTNDFTFPNLSGQTIQPNECTSIIISFSGGSIGSKQTEWVGVANSGCCINIRAFGSVGETITPPTGCAIDFGYVSAGDTVISSFNVTTSELNGTNIYLSGNSSDFIFDRNHIINGTTSIPVTFNPSSTFGDKTTSLILSGGCSQHQFNICGYSQFSGSFYGDPVTATTFTNCCTDITVPIYNNVLDADYVTITSISFTNSELSQGSITLPTQINKGECLNLEYEFCPLTNGVTTTEVTVDYMYSGSSVYIGQTTVDLMLIGYEHPFNSVNGNTCFDFLCYSGNSGYTLNLVNNTPIDLSVYYFVNPVNDYNIVNFVDLNPTNFILVSGNTTGSIDFNLYPWLLTTATTFNQSFELTLVDPNCCVSKTQCINVNFCDITTTDTFGYPHNISCYGGSDGEISFTINGCNDQTYNITWSSSTEQLQFSSTTANGLIADTYTIKIEDECNQTYYKTVTLTQPEPLFAEINTYNPSDYCKDNLPQLCGIVPDGTVNPAGYVTISKETVIRVVNNDIHNIPGQTKTGFQGADPRTNKVGNSREVGANNAFKNYILDFAAGAFERYKQKKIYEEIITEKKWDDIVSEQLQGCCFVSYVTGGTSPYTYSWTGPNGYTSDSPNLFNIPCCDPYVLTITDANGCTFTTSGSCDTCSFGVSELTVLRPTCIYDETGEIQVVVTGNCSNYGSVLDGLSGQYIISLESSSWIESYTGTSATFDDLGVGLYELNVEDLETGCLMTPRKINITPYVKFNIGITTTGTTCLESCDGVIDVNTTLISTTPVCTGYTENNYFLYKLNDGNYVTGSTFTNLCSGNYTVTVKDLCTGCEKTQTIKVPNLNLFNVQTEVIDASSESSSDGQITLIINNGQPFESCRILTENNDLGFVLENDCWLLFEKDSSNEYYFINCIKEKNTNNTYTISNLKPGTYYYEIEDNNHCVFTSKVIVGYKTRKQNKGFGVDTKSTGLYGGFSIEKI